MKKRGLIIACCAAIPAIVLFSSLAVSGDQPSQGPKVTAKVLIKTTMGDIEVALYGESAPITVTNFLKYVDRKFYDSTLFHRVIPDFMIQGGGYTKTMNEKPTDPPIKLEIAPDLKHKPGVIAMARTPDPNSAKAQFYICDGTPSRLDGNYAAFGQVTKGMEVVHAIARVPVHSVGELQNVPKTKVVIQSIRRL